MNSLSRRTWIGMLVLAALFVIAGQASADVHVQSTPIRNRVDFHWAFPCSSVPSAGGHYDTMTVGRPPDDILAAVSEHDPDDPNNNVLLGGAVQNGQEQTYVRTEGCATAGGNSFKISAVLPWTAISSQAKPLKFKIDRTVVPLAPDVVTLTYTGGTLQTYAASASDQARATLKLIVYPDQATADADVGLNGTGSVFYDAATLTSSGTLIPLQGLSLSDFTVVGDGTGLFTAMLLTVNASSVLFLSFPLSP